MLTMHLIGMPPNVIQNFKQPFVQAENTLTRSIEGLGLGLTIADHAARKQNARLDIFSEPGRGTKVHLDLPLYS